MTITSTVFQQNDPIPANYGRNGQNINPPLTFSEVPAEAKTLALIVEDPDAPKGVFTHWILYNMSPATLQIMEAQLPLNAKQATNDYGNQQYDGPAPPSGTHRYFFKVFALDKKLDIKPTAKRDEFYKAVEGGVIAQAEIIGTFVATG